MTTDYKPGMYDDVGVAAEREGLTVRRVLVRLALVDIPHADRRRGTLKTGKLPKPSPLRFLSSWMPVPSAMTQLNVG
jgi:hypothetical protein